MSEAACGRASDSIRLGPGRRRPSGVRIRWCEGKVVSDSRACFPRAASVRAQISFLRSVVMHWPGRIQSCANTSSGNMKDVLLTGSTLAQTSRARGPLCHECAGRRELSAARRKCSSEGNVCTRRTVQPLLRARVCFLCTDASRIHPETCSIFCAGSSATLFRRLKLFARAQEGQLRG